MIDARTDESQARFRTVARESTALAEEAIAGMNGVASAFERRSDDRRAVEICARPGAGQRDGMFCLANVQRLRVVLRIDGDSPHPQLGGGARDANGDFAAIRDQQIHPLTSPVPTFSLLGRGYANNVVAGKSRAF